VLRTAVGREVDEGDDRWGLGISEREREKGGARASWAKRWVAAAAALAGPAHAGRGEGEE
jgi:hypothetical protein